MPVVKHSIILTLFASTFLLSSGALSASVNKAMAFPILARY
jgi:hypothetical protein